MREASGRGLLAVLLLAVAAGCVGGSKGLSAEDKERLKPFILDAVPGDIPHKIDVNFENKIHLVGYKFEPESAHPGQEVKLTYYWRCDDPVEDGWMLFTHVKDEGNGKMGNADFVGPLREERDNHQILGPEHWERGKVYVDSQTYRLPDDVTGSEMTVIVGIWKVDARLRIVGGPNDGENGAIVGKIKTGIVPKGEEHTNVEALPSLTVVKLAANDRITIDGKGSEPEWEGAASTGPFVDVGTGKPNPGFPVQGSTKLLWDDKNLYVLAEISEADPYVGFTDAKAQPGDFTAAKQPKLWTKDTFEMMVDPGPDGDDKNYYELQINPQNKVFKSQFDTLQQPNGGPNGPFGHEDWDPKLKSAVQIQHGADGKTTGYAVEIAVPWTAYSKAVDHAPKSGDVWRVNFYAMKNNGGVSWSPILGRGNFHYAPRFARVTWAIPGQMPVAGDGPAADGGAKGLTAAMPDGGRPLMPFPRGSAPIHLVPRPMRAAPPAPSSP